VALAVFVIEEVGVDRGGKARILVFLAPGSRTGAKFEGGTTDPIRKG